MNELDLSGAWGDFWGSVQSTLGSVTTVMSAVGVVLLLFAFIKWGWDRRRGGGGNSGAVWGSVLVGALLSAPEVILPVILQVIDVLVNALIGIWGATGGSGEGGGGGGGGRGGGRD